MNSEYWRERFQIYEEATSKNVLELQENLRTEYLVAQKDIETKIRSWYQKFADNNEISMAEAKKWLSKNELKEFAWTVDEYIKYATDNLDEAWTKQLINASAKVHISRLVALEVECQQTLERLFGNEVDEIDDFLKASYAGSYTNTAYEIQKGLNVGFDVAKISDSQLENIICKPWTVDGRTFSDKIWNRKDELVSELHSQLTQTILQGKSPQGAIAAIAKKFGNGDMNKGALYNAGRLVMTESAYFNSLGKKESFKDLGVEQFEIDATLDSHTSEICQSKDGLVFDMKYFEPTVTAPPFHPWCRTTTVPYFDDEFTAGDLKAARNADGEVYNVPADMTYEKWQETFADGGTKDGLNILNVFDDSGDTNLKNEDLNLQNSDLSATLEKVGDNVNYVGKLDKDIYKCIADDIVSDEVIITDERIQHIKDRHSNDYELIAPYLAQAISDPDYIIEDKQVDTGLILKYVDIADVRFQMVLKLQTQPNEKGFKNSIISSWRISPERWDNYLRNKKILYKKE